jgi:hypothetical protein
MPNLDVALIAFGKLIGLMDGTGTVQWAWFADPLNKSLLGIPANRASLGVLMRALLELEDAATDPVFDANGLIWQPVLSSSPVAAPGPRSEGVGPRCGADDRSRRGGADVEHQRGHVDARVWAGAVQHGGSGAADVYELRHAERGLYQRADAAAGRGQQDGRIARAGTSRMP